MMLRLKDADLFTPRRRGRCDLLIGGGRILAIDSRIEPIGLAVPTIDLEGARVVPGLVDAHVHLTGGGGEDGFGSRLPELGIDELVVSGITTAVGVLGTDCATRSPIGLLAVVRKLAACGLTGSMWTGGYTVPPPTITGDLRRDILVVPEVLGAGEIAISDHRGSNPSVESLIGLAGDCHVAGMLAAKRAKLHLHVGDGRRGLEPIVDALERSDLPASVFYPTHVNRNPEVWAQAKELATRGVTVDVTATEPGADGIASADAIVDWIETGLPLHRLTMSSDAGGSLPRFDAHGQLTQYEVGRPHGLLQTLAAVVDRGADLETALSVVTSGVADYLGMRAKGRLEPGADADLCVLDSRCQPRAVLAGGRWLMGFGGLQTGMEVA